jgi:hypothetical protein
MRYTLPGRPKLPPLKLINRINEKTLASEKGYFAFTALLEGARSKTSYEYKSDKGPFSTKFNLRQWITDNSSSDRRY